MSEVIFAELVLDDCVLRIPFICQMCGRCCEMLGRVVFDPAENKIYMEDFDVISKHVNVYNVLEEIKRNLEVNHPVLIKCPFLKDKKCSIHPIRPRSCREFPVRGDEGVGCPGLKRLREIANAFPFRSLNLKIAKIKDLKRTEVPIKYLGIFLMFNPSYEELKLFLTINKVFRNKRKV